MRDRVQLKPVSKKERIDVLDALRGFAIFGIFMINARVFSGYAYMENEEKNDLLLAQWNTAFDQMHSIFFSGKFYTLFALLFGIGFAIQFIRASSAGSSFNLHFSRRLFFLLLIGLIHLWGIWFSDILVLYALCGYVLILFKRLSDRGLLIAVFLILCIPGLYSWYLQSVDGGYANAVYEHVNESWAEAGLPHASGDNGAFQMRDVVEVIQSESWRTVIKFNYIGPLLRGYIYILDARFFYVLGFFILGFWTGRRILQHKLHENRSLLANIAVVGLLLGLPLNYLIMTGNPTGLDNQTYLIIRNMLEPFGYAALTSAYIAIFMLIYLTDFRKFLTPIFSPVGKTALTNYILQSFIGIFLFYGIGLGLGVYPGSAYLTAIVFLVFGFQIIISVLWLKMFRYGPLEWLWRSLTYGRIMTGQREK